MREEQDRPSFEVATAVSLDLFAPPLAVLLRPAPVFGAAVPEAPVHEDCDPCSREDEICPATRPDDDSVDAVSCTEGTGQGGPPSAGIWLRKS